MAHRPILVAENPYRVYLSAELRRLADDRQAASDFSVLVSPGLPHLRLGDSGRKVRRRLPNGDAVDRFVGGLSERDLEALGVACSAWRVNPVAEKIRQFNKDWEVVSVPVSDLEIDLAESGLHDEFRRLDHRLIALASSPAVLEAAPYATHSVGDAVEFQVVLAIPHLIRYRIFDGVHRAIQLARNGATDLSICIPTAG